MNNSKGLLSTKAGSVGSVLINESTRSYNNMISVDTDDYVAPRDLQHLINYRMDEQSHVYGQTGKLKNLLLKSSINII